MKVNGSTISITLDAEDIQHLMSGGTTVVADEDSEVKAKVKCHESLSFTVITPTEEE